MFSFTIIFSILISAQKGKKKNRHETFIQSTVKLWQEHRLRLRVSSFL